MGLFSKKDAAKSTGSSVRSVSKAWHQARNDGAKEGGKWSPGNRGEKDEVKSTK